MNCLSYKDYLFKHKNMEETQKLLLDYSYLELGPNYDYSNVYNNFDIRNRDDKENPNKHFVRFIRNPDNFAFTLKHIFNVNPLPFQLAILKELWYRKYPMLIASRGASKSFTLAVYALLRAFITQGSRVVIVGAAFRQAKVVFDYIERIWNGAPILRDIVNSDKNLAGLAGPRRENDKLSCRIGASEIIGLPIGTGEKIRGQRATHIIADEFASLNQEIYENVIAGFAAVSANPVEEVKRRAKAKAIREMATLLQDKDTMEITAQGMGNQAIISGTAYYDFNHFSTYWKKYCKIVKSRGDSNKLMEVFGGAIEPGFDWRDYSVIRIPVELLPPGFMDEKHVARSKATVHSGIYNMEFGSCFSTDSTGFFKRSLIQNCVAPVSTVSEGEICFSASLTGNPDCKYIYGIDPASERDNFSIVVLEIHKTHRRIVYCWTTNRASHTEKIKAGLVSEQDFYGYVARKVRDLMKVFPTNNIALDTQGGGVAVEEALHDTAKIKPGEQPIWRVIDEEKPHQYDDFAGQHIINLINFSDANWVREANHGMRKDFEDRVLLFPEFDNASISFAAEEDLSNNRRWDTLEDAVMEIEELKDELATIVHTQTGTSMRDRWDTPEVKTAGNKKGRLRKDRYSSLLMANMCARQIDRAFDEVPMSVAYGGFIGDVGNLKRSTTNDFWGDSGGLYGSEFGIMVRRS